MKTLMFILLSFAVVGFAVSTPGEAAIDPESISGIWLLDEGADDLAEDSSEKGNDGEIKGKPDWIEGKYGQALQFDGEDDFIQIPDNESLRAYEEVTVMAWIRLDRYTFPGVDWQGVIAKSNNPRSYSIYTDNTKQALIAFHFQGNHVVALSGETLPEGEWLHLAFVTTTDDSGGKIKCYIDGRMTKETPSPVLQGLPGDGDTEDVVIAKTWEGQRFFGGAMDEVGLFMTALSDEEVKRIAENGLERGLGILAVDPGGKLATMWSKIKAK